MPELSREDPARSVTACEVIADQCLGEMITVALGGVDEVDAAVRRRIEDLVGLSLAEVDSPFAAQLPGAKADDGYGKTGAAERQEAHYRSRRGTTLSSIAGHAADRGSRS